MCKEKKALNILWTSRAPGPGGTGVRELEAVEHVCAHVCVHTGLAGRGGGNARQSQTDLRGMRGADLHTDCTGTGARW